MTVKTIHKVNSLDVLLSLAKRKKRGFADFSPARLRFVDVRANVRQIQQFKALFNTSELPCSYLFVMAYRYLAFVLANSAIPSRLLGLIHLSSCYQQLAAHQWLAPTDLEIAITDSYQTAKGIHYCIEIKAFQQDQLTLISENVVLDKIRDYRSKAHQGDKKKSAVSGKPLAKQALTKLIAKRYARLSGDYNPIHLSDRLAKLWGLKRAVIHGMYNVHWVLTQPAMVKLISGKTIEVAFNKPGYLPTNINLYALAEHELAFGLFNDALSLRYLTLNFT